MRLKPLVCLMVAIFMVGIVPAAAAADIVVLGLFRDKAVVRIDGKQRVLSAGKTSPEGVTLISANSSAAVIEVDGIRSTYTLGSHIGGHFSEPELVEVRVWSNERGMYKTVGSINGYPVNFLVDTGATTIAMNSVEARRLGIRYRLEGTVGAAATASDIVKTYKVKLDRVKVGDLMLRNVDAMVLEGSLPRDVLLGMSFLGRLEIRNDGRSMVLKKKY